jgi:hypothetical protein
VIEDQQLAAPIFADDARVSRDRVTVAEYEAMAIDERLRAHRIQEQFASGAVRAHHGMTCATTSSATEWR